MRASGRRLEHVDPICEGREELWRWVCILRPKRHVHHRAAPASEHSECLLDRHNANGGDACIPILAPYRHDQKHAYGGKDTDQSALVHALTLVPAPRSAEHRG